MSNANTDALVPAAWYRPCAAPLWAHPVLIHQHEPPAPYTERQALNVGWVKFYSADTIERLQRERDEEKRRWELAFSFVFEMAEGHSVRGDDCGRLAKAVLAARAAYVKSETPT